VAGNIAEFRFAGANRPGQRLFDKVQLIRDVTERVGLAA
jgi:hypothetical protein